MARKKVKPADRKKVGRKCLYSLEMVERIAALAAQGMTDADICKSVGIGYSTLYDWKSGRPELVAALKVAKQRVDELVVSALMQRARGYSHPAEKIMLSKDGRIVRVKYTERYPPDTTACIFWLKNRDRENWRDVMRHQVNGGLNHNLTGDDAKPVRVVITLPSNGREAG